MTPAAILLPLLLAAGPVSAARTPTACAGQPGNAIPAGFKGERVNIEGAGGYHLGGMLLRRPPKPARPMPALLLLHELGADRQGWTPIMLPQAARGLTVLALDLRGHGETPSLNRNARTAGELQPADYQLMVEDVRNALAFLAAQKGVIKGQIGIVGSSLGANLALIAAAQPWARDVKAVVAISPGLDYRGLATEAAARAVPAGTKVLLIASPGDAYSYESCKTLTALFHGPREFFEAEGDGHGFKLFAGLAVPKIHNWLVSQLDNPAPPRRR